MSAIVETAKENQPSHENRMTSAVGADGLVKDVSNIDEPGPVGCYLVFENSSGGRLVLHYSQGHVPDNAVGFFGGGKPIPRWKFEANCGRTELIKGIAGGDANRRKYFIGWCQFLKLAKQNGAKVISFQVRGQGVPVDVYGYTVSKNAPEYIELEEGMTDLAKYDAIAVMQKHHEFLKGVKSIHVSNFCELAGIAGASTMLSN
jgi:hypothetical protein